VTASPFIVTVPVLKPPLLIPAVKAVFTEGGEEPHENPKVST
jgi:hypothetical protein